MSATNNKTIATDASVEEYINKLPDKQQSDARTLVAMMTQIAGQPPKMWGPTIVGFGQYHYRYDTGREGDMAAISFSCRASGPVVYLVDGTSNYEAALKNLGPHKTGRACLYLKSLATLDMAVLKAVITESYKSVMSQSPNMGRAS